MGLFFWRKNEEAATEKTVYLIDTENVKSVWVELLDKLTEEDRVYVFFTRNSGNVPYEAITGITEKNKHIIAQECFTGKNGLDFQLVSYLGYLIRGNEKAEYIIVTDDAGFDAAVKFWEKKGIKIQRKTASEVSGKPAKKMTRKPVAKRDVVPKSTKAVKASAAAKTQPAKDQPKKETPKAPQTKAETPKSSQPKQETAKAAQPKTVTTKAAQPKTETAKAAQPKTETAKAAQPKAETTKAAQPNQETVKASQPKPEASKAQSQKPKPLREGAVTGVDLLPYLPDESIEQLNKVAECICKAGSPKNLADIHDGIEKLYRDEKASAIYRQIKPSIREIYRNARK